MKHVKDALSYLMSFDPSSYSSTTKAIILRLRDTHNASLKVDTGIAFTKETQDAKEAVVDWLRQSPVYVWPYSDIEYSEDFQVATLTLRIDAAVTKALGVRDEGTPVNYELGKEVARTLFALFRHVNGYRPIKIG